MRNDNVNHPSHYTSGPFECIELTARYPFLGGNAIKYVYRWQGKNGLEDLKKALWYLNRAKEESPYEPLGLYPLDSFVPPYCDFHTDDEAVRMLRKLARLNWQNMRGFWKGMAELACDHKSGYTRAKKTLERRIRLLDVYGQINVYGVTTKSERHKRSYWTRTADGNGIGGRKAPVPYGS